MLRKNHVSREVLLPYSAVQMFDLVNDVAAYPDFLPWCSGSEILDVSTEEMTARIDVAMGGLRHSFTTCNTLEPARNITLTLVDGPFSDLTGSWTFTQLGEEGCKVSMQMTFGFSSRLVSMTFGKVFQLAVNQLIDAFCKRAAHIYGE